MLDIQLLRSELTQVAARLQQRGYSLDTEKFERVEAERKAIQTRTQELQAKRNRCPSRSAPPRAGARTRPRQWPRWARSATS